MAKVHVTVGAVQGAGSSFSAFPVMDGPGVATTTLSSTGSSVASDLGNPTGVVARDQFVTIYAAGAIFVSFGAAPTAGDNEGHVVPAGVPRSFRRSGAIKIAIKDFA